jgi:hypothetical protein
VDGYSSTTSETAERSDDPAQRSPLVHTVPSRSLSILRDAALLLLITFFIPLGSVWAFSGCASRTDATTLGDASAWEMSRGTTLSVKTHTGQQTESITLESQPVGCFVPLVAICVFALTFAVSTVGMAQRLVFWVGFLGSIAVGIIVVHLSMNLSVPGDQLWLLRQKAGSESSMEIPELRFDWGYGGPLLFVVLTAMGISSMVGLDVGSEARHQKSLERSAARATLRREYPTQGPMA